MLSIRSLASSRFSARMLNLAGVGPRRNSAPWVTSMTASPRARNLVPELAAHSATRRSSGNRDQGPFLRCPVARVLVECAS